MSKELIAWLREICIDERGHQAADLIEAQQSWIASLEQNARDADRMYKELETELAEQQKRIAELEAERDTEIARNRPLRSLIASLEEQKSIWNKKKTAATEAVKTLDSEREANALLTEQLTAAQAQIKVLRDALENCRLLAARHRKEEWATHILRFCESGGSVANPLRQDDSALRELLKAEREACAKVIERLISGDGVCADDGVWIHDCAEAIRAMEDQ